MRYPRALLWLPVGVLCLVRTEAAFPQHPGPWDDRGAMLPEQLGRDALDGASPRRGKRPAPAPLCQPPWRPAPSRGAGDGEHVSAVADTTPPSPPGNLAVVTESIHSILARWDPAYDPESGVAYYAFAIGRTPGGTDLGWWQSVGESQAGEVSPSKLGLAEGDSLFFSVAAVNGAGVWSRVETSGLIVIAWEELGNPSNEITIAYSPGWRMGELDTLQGFLPRMLPILEAAYGVPSHSFTVTLVKDPLFTRANVFYPDVNEIHMFTIDLQLLTHEIIHAFRDNVILSSDDHWRFSPVLSGFEESFAQGLSYVCMNRYIELHPDDPLVRPDWLFGSSNDCDYDFQNTDLLTTTDLWSDGGGTGIFWLRYEMAAAAMIKITKEHPAFARDFNQAYYQRLNSDHALRSSRPLVLDIVRQVAPATEGRESGQWIDRQHVFDCRIRTGRKLWVRTQHYPGWLEYLIFQHVFYYETFANGSEWAYWDGVGETWRYHGLNGARGLGVIRDGRGGIVWRRELIVEPVDNPPVYYGFGSARVHMSTDDDTEPWPGGDENAFALGLHEFGLYWLELSFGDVTARVPRLMGDRLRSTRGVAGAVLNAGSGRIYLDHEAFPAEEPIPVENGVFCGERQWASLLNPRTGYRDTRPGRVFVVFVDDAGRMYRDQRNIDLGSWSGNQFFLFDTLTMSEVDTVASIAAEPPGLDFGVVAVDSTAARTVRITNPSPAALRVDSQYVGHGDFSCSSVTVPAWLGPGEGLDVMVTFTPESVRRYADTLYVLNSSLTPRLAVPLEGEGGASPGGGGEAELAGGHTVLWQNVPNPFRARTRIGFSLARRGSVSLRVFDVMGRTVATLVAGELGAGDHTVVLGGEKLASGVYFYELQVKPVSDGGAPAASQHVHRKRLELLK